MKNLVNISNELMEKIKSYMDDDLREQVYFNCAPYTNEQFITAYAYRLDDKQEEDFRNFLSDGMNLDLDDIIYTAYWECYSFKTIPYDLFDCLKNDSPYIISVEPLCSVMLETGVVAYKIKMESGDIVTYVNFNTGI